MRAYVFTDKSLERYAGRFVWLSVNTEDAKNAPFLKKYPIPALPTLLVLDPTGEKIVLRYVGGATVGQLAKILDDASRKGGTSADQILAEADKLASQGKHADAAKLYESALEKAPKNWPKYGRTTESLMYSMASSNDPERCAEKGLSLSEHLGETTSGANDAAAGLSCATDLDAKNPKRGVLIASLEKRIRTALDDPKLDFSGDDRSGLYMALIDARNAVNDTEGATKLKREWLAFLEKSAAEAKTPEQRAVYDSHRLTAYLDLGEPQKAIRMLEQSEKDFPEDYNPPARLAIAYNAMKEYDKALEASDRALKLVYGPRKLQLLRNRADIYTAKGDKEAARKTIADAIAYAKQLPEGQRSERTIAALEKRLKQMEQ